MTAVAHTLYLTHTLSLTHTHTGNDGIVSCFFTLLTVEFSPIFMYFHWLNEFFCLLLKADEVEVSPSAWPFPQIPHFSAHESEINRSDRFYSLSMQEAGAAPAAATSSQPNSWAPARRHRKRLRSAALPAAARCSRRSS